MADRIAGFVFEHATVLLPLIALLCATAIVVLVRRWPRGWLRRAGSAILVLAAISVAALACTLLYAERNIRSILRHRVEVLRLQRAHGTAPLRVADLKGNVVVLNFWATWCAPCREEMPDLNRLADQYAKQRVTVLTITDEKADRIALYEQKVLRLRTLVATFESDQPRGALASMAYQGRPTTVILDREGRIQDILIGRQSYERLRTAIEDEL